MDLSIIIPVWNEQSKIVPDIKNIDVYFSKSRLKVELIIVDDGSNDQTVAITREALKSIAMGSKILTGEHRGKGYAVRKGMLASQGKIVMFMDCGSNVPLSFIDKGVTLLQAEKKDLLLGSRYNPQSKIILDMVWFRKITSYLFRNFVKTFLNLPKKISDSQCGFKIFNGDMAREVFAKVKTDGFLFDVEVILLCLARNCQLTEMPLEWHCDRDSRLSIFGSLLPVIRELFQLRKL